jgi:hypothetical protein
VNGEIGKAVASNAQTYKKEVIKTSIGTEVKKYDAGYGKNDKENIISLKNMGVFGLVMVCVKIPHKTVHHIFVGEPSNAFHEQKNSKGNKKINHT